MTGFVVTDYIKRYRGGREAMSAWLARGELISREDVVDGVETFPETFAKLFAGENNGKLMIRAAQE